MIEPLIPPLDRMGRECELDISEDFDAVQFVLGTECLKREQFRFALDFLVVRSTAKNSDELSRARPR